MRTALLLLSVAFSLPVLAEPAAAPPAKPSAARTLAAPASPDARLRGAYTFERDGWTYIHLEGSPARIGFQHGYLLAAKIEDALRVFRIEAEHNSDRPWSFFRNAGRTVLWPQIEPEYREELTGIVAGLHAQHSTLDLWDLVAFNGIIELNHYYLPTVNAREKKKNPPKAVAPGKCSALIATGSATRDGRIVIAHSNWSSYADGTRWQMVFDIAPTHGQRLLMDGVAGIITSDDDFGLNSAGIMMTETTLPMMKGFDPKGIPEFVRSRKALQYATSVDEFAAIMKKGNNGGYANSWLIGDRKTGEIGYLELGLHHTPFTKKKDGYFVSDNFAVDPELIRDDSRGFDPSNPESSMNARHTRAEQFLQQHMGAIDIAAAEAYLSDHWDSYEKKIDAGKRSLCGHEETSPVGEKVWGDAPFDPSGAVTGKVTDSELVAQMSFIGRAGHPCGEDFLAAPFLKAHPEFAWQRPILLDMKAGPWAKFTAGEKPPLK